MQLLLYYFRERRTRASPQTYQLVQLWSSIRYGVCMFSIKLQHHKAAASAHLPQSWQVCDWWAQRLVGRINMIFIWKICKRAKSPKQGMSLPVCLPLLKQKQQGERGGVSLSSQWQSIRKQSQEPEAGVRMQGSGFRNLQRSWENIASLFPAVCSDCVLM